MVTVKYYLLLSFALFWNRNLFCLYDFPFAQLHLLYVLFVCSGIFIQLFVLFWFLCHPWFILFYSNLYLFLMVLPSTMLLVMSLHSIIFLVCLFRCVCVCVCVCMCVCVCVCACWSIFVDTEVLLYVSSIHLIRFVSRRLWYIINCAHLCNTL